MAAGGAAQPSWLEGLGTEVSGARCRVYLLSFSRLLEETLAAAGGALRSLELLTKKDLVAFVHDAFDKPECVAGRPGRPRVRETPLVRKLVAVCESHEDGSPHFHVAVLLTEACRWDAVKRALRVRYQLAAHFSCTHREWWSALRYLTHTTKRKLEVDADREVWLAEGESFDAFKESQEPYNAKAWRTKREKRDMEAAADGQPASFTKLDFTTLVLSEGLQSRAAVLRYVQRCGTDAMRAFVNKNQRRLTEYLEDAKEWADAPRVADEEQLTDWALVCRTAAGSCQHGEECSYRKAAAEIFEGNSASFDWRRLAVCLRNVMVTGPSKDTRIPFLTGTTNTGKSTLMDPCDDLFGFEHVFHLPALSDGKYALSNWANNKRFVYWDEFDPVEFADKGILPATTFKKAFGGQWFEIQRAQNWHDGNKDWRWQRGVVFTNKAEDLWRTTANVTAEDIRHIQSRVECFRFTHRVVPAGARPRRGNVLACPLCMAKWIVAGAAEHDAGQIVAVMPPASSSGDDNIDASRHVAGLDELLRAAQLPPEAANMLAQDVLHAGAVHVQELSKHDWEDLPSWSILKPLERRRVLTRVQP